MKVCQAESGHVARIVCPYHQWSYARNGELVACGGMDNTLFIYIAGDNGTSAEGGFVGMYNEMTYFNAVTEKVEDLIPLIDKWGSPKTFL